MQTVAVVETVNQGRFQVNVGGEWLAGDYSEEQAHTYLGRHNARKVSGGQGVVGIYRIPSPYTPKLAVG